MRTMFLAGLSRAVLAVTLGMTTAAGAADLGGYSGGSVKDGYMPVTTSSAGPCYVRGDVGYSWSTAPGSEYVGNVDPSMWNQSMGDSWLFEAGIGCGSGSRGWRGEATLGTHGERTFKGTYSNFPGGLPPATSETLSADVRSHTLMFNGYYDFGKVGGFVPYVGAGVGVAYNSMGDIKSTLAGSNVVYGEDKVSFAWALMAGVGYQLSERTILDIGYRYIDLGSARGGRVDSAGFANPRLDVSDLAAHEVKVGLRYHFGGASDCCSYAAMK